MDGSFVREIVGQAAPTFHSEFEGITYADRKFTPILPPTATTLVAHTLTSIVDYCNRQLEDGKYIIQVVNPGIVHLISELSETSRQRETLVQAELLQDHFNFNKWLDSESFNIGLRAMFVRDDNLEIVAGCVAKIKQGSEVVHDDDGFTTRAKVKTGIATEGWQEVPNPLQLRPFRTFTEVEQPASNFILRVKGGNQEKPYAALHEADGGAWKNTAVKDIKDFFEFELKKLIETETITVIA